MTQTHPNRPHPLSALLRMLLLTPALGAGSLHAAPEGGTVSGGSGTIEQTGLTTTIVQQSARLAIDWRSFNLANGEHVQFIQPSADAVALNRILDANPSTILGSLSANGRIFLLNPNGILFGASARLDVGGLVAAGMALDGEALADRLRLVGSGLVENRGEIHAGAGGITLLGGEVVNTGQLHSQMGDVTLSGGEQLLLDLAGDQLLLVALDAASVRATNSGQIVAEGGSVRLGGDPMAGAVNNQGLVRASRIEARGGEVYLSGAQLDQGGSLVATSRIDLQGATLQLTGSLLGGAGAVIVAEAQGDLLLQGAELQADGGEVTLLGARVALLDATRVDVSAAQAGGVIRIGGDYQGGELSRADYTLVDSGVRLDASAVAGQGGSIVVWSDVATRFAGHADVSGATGGWVETSSAGVLGFTGSVSLDGTQGADGRLLLDPRDLTITPGAAGSLDGSVELADLWLALAEGGSSESVSLAALEAVSAGTITLQAGRSLTIADLSQGDDGSLDLAAGVNLVLETRNSLSDGSGGIDFDNADNAIRASGGGTLTLRAGSDGAARGDLINIGRLSSDSGDLSLSAADALELAGDLSTSGTLTLSAGGGLEQRAGTLQVGRLDLDVGADATLANANRIGTLAGQVGGALNLRNAADITLDDLSGGGLIELRNQGAIQVAGLTQSSGTLRLDSGGSGAIGGTGQLRAARLELQTLTGTGAVGSSATPLATQAASLAIGRPVGVQGVALLHSGDLTIDTLYLASDAPLDLSVSGNLQLPGQGLDTGSADLTIRAADLTTGGSLISRARITLAASGWLTLDHGLYAGSEIALSGGAGIVQGGGSLSAPSLTLDAGGAVSLKRYNLIDTLSGQVTDGSLELRSNSATLSVGDLQVDQGTLVLNHTGDILLAGRLEARDGVTLGASGAITQSGGGITTSTLALSANQGIDLRLGSQQVASLQATNRTSGDLRIANQGAVTLTSLVGASGSLVELDNLGAITLTGAVRVEAGVLDLDTGGSGAILGSGYLSAADIRLQTHAGSGALGSSATPLRITGASQLSLGQGTGLAGVDLLASGDLTLTSLQLTADALVAVRAGGQLTLPVGDLSAASLTFSGAGDLSSAGALSASGALSLKSGAALLLDHDLSAPQITLTSGAGITQRGGVLSATSLAITAAGDLALTQDNHLAALTLRNNLLASNQLHNTQTLSLGSVTLASGSSLDLSLLGDLQLVGALSLVGGTAQIAVSGGVTQGSAGITAHGLTLATGNGATLSGSNRLDQVALTNLAGTLTLRTLNDTALSVTALSQSGGGSVTLNHAGDLNLDGDLLASGADLALTSGAALSQNSGTVVAERLLLTGQRGITLDNSTVSRLWLQNSGSGDVRLSNSGALVVERLIGASGGTLQLDVLGDLTLGGTLSAKGGASLLSASGLLRLDSNYAADAGTLQLQAERLVGTGRVTAQTLTLDSVDGIALSGSHSIARLAVGNSGSGAVSLKSSATSLEVTRLDQLGGDLTLSHTGDLRFSAPLEVAGAVTLSLSGSAQLDLGEVGLNSHVGALSVTAQGVTLRGDLSASAIDLSRAGGVTLVGTRTLSAGSGGIALPASLVRSAPGATLTLDASGGAIALGRVGAAGAELAALTLRGASATLAGDIYANAQDFSAVGDLTLATSLTLDADAGAGGIYLAGSRLHGAGHDLTLQLASGGNLSPLTLGAAEGLGRLDINADDGVDLGLEGGLLAAGQLALDGLRGELRLRGSLSGDAGIDLTPLDRVVLSGSGDQVALLSAGGAIDLSGTPVVDPGGDSTLRIDAGGGRVTLAAVGASGAALDALWVDGTAASDGLLTLGGDLYADAIDLSGREGGILIDASRTLVADSGSGAIDLSGSALVAGASGMGLTLRAGATDAIRVAAIGSAGVPLAALSLSGGALTVGGDLYAAAQRFQGSGSLTLVGDTLFDASSGPGDIDLSGLTLTASPPGSRLSLVARSADRLLIHQLGSSAEPFAQVTLAAGAATLDGDIYSAGLDARALALLTLGAAVTLDLDSGAGSLDLAATQIVGGGHDLTLLADDPLLLHTTALGTMVGIGTLTLALDDGLSLVGDAQLQQLVSNTLSGALRLAGSLSVAQGDLDLSQASGIELVGSGDTLLLKSSLGAVRLADVHDAGGDTRLSLSAATVLELGQVGAAGAALDALDVQGQQLILGGDLYADRLGLAGLTQGLTISGNRRLDASSGRGDIDLRATPLLATSANASLQLVATSSDTLTLASVGSLGLPLASLTLSGGTAHLYGDLYAAQQVYSGLVEMDLHGARTLDASSGSGDLRLGATRLRAADEDAALSLRNQAGALTTLGSVGSVANPLSAFDFSGGALRLAGDLYAMRQGFSGSSVTLERDLTLAVGGGDGGLDLSGAPLVGAGYSLRIDAASGANSSPVTLGAISGVNQLDLNVDDALTLFGDLDLVSLASDGASGTLSLQGSVSLASGALDLSTLSSISLDGRGDALRLATQGGAIRLGRVTLDDPGSDTRLTLDAGSGTLYARDSAIGMVAAIGQLGLRAANLQLGDVHALQLDAIDGAVALAGELVAEGGDLILNGTLTLQGASALASGADLTLSSAVDGAYALDLSAPGAIRVTASLGATHPLAGLTAQGDSLSLTQVDATGAVRLSAADIDISGDLVTTNHAPIEVNAGHSLTLSGTQVSAAGELTLRGGGTITSAADLSTQGEALVVEDTLVLTDSVRIDSAGGLLALAAVSGSLDGTPEQLTLAAGSGSLSLGPVSGAAGAISTQGLTDLSVESAGSVQLDTIRISGALRLAGSALTQLQGAVQAGSATLSGTDYLIGAPMLLADTLTLAHSGTLTTQTGATLSAANGLFATGALVIGADLASAGGDIRLTQGLRLADGAVVGLNSAGGAIQLGELRGTAGGASEALTLNAGTGDITLARVSGAAGVADSSGLTDLTFTASHALTLSEVGITGALRQTTAATGTTTLGGVVHAGSVALRGVDLLIAAPLEASTTLSSDHSGLLTTLAGATLSAATGITLQGDVLAAADLSTQGGDLLVKGDFTLAEGRALRLESNGGRLTLNGAVAGSSGGVAEQLTLDSGSGALTLAAVSGAAGVADSRGLSSLTIESSGDAQLGPVALSGALTQGQGGTSHYTATLAVGSLDLTSERLLFDAPVTIGAQGVLHATQVESALGASLQSGGALQIVADALLGGDLRVTSGALTLEGALQLREGADLSLTTLNGEMNLLGQVSGTGAGVEEQLTLDSGQRRLTLGALAATPSGAVSGGLGRVEVRQAGEVLYGAIDLLGDLVQSDSGTLTTRFTEGVSLGSATLSGVAFSLEQAFSASGALSVDNQGTLVQASAAPLAAALGIQIAGDVQLGADVTSAGAIRIGGETVIADGAQVRIDSQAGDGAITLVGLTHGVDGGLGEHLTLASGSGAIHLGPLRSLESGAGSNGLSDLLIVSSGDLSFDSLLLSGGVTQLAGSGTTHFSAGVEVAYLALTGRDYLFDAPLQVSGHFSLSDSGTSVQAAGASIEAQSLLRDGSGSLTLNAALSTLGGAMVLGGSVQLGADITLSSAGGDITIGGPLDGAQRLTLLADGGAIVASAGLGSSVALSSLEAQGASLSLAGVRTLGEQRYSADTLDFTGGSASLVGGGELVITPQSVGRRLALGFGSAQVDALDLSDTDLAALAPGFSRIVLGSSANAGAVFSDTALFADDLLLYASALTLGGLNGAGTVTLVADSVVASGSGTQLAADQLNLTISGDMGANDAPLQMAVGRIGGHLGGSLYGLNTGDLSLVSQLDVAGDLQLDVDGLLSVPTALKLMVQGAGVLGLGDLALEGMLQADAGLTLAAYDGATLALGTQLGALSISEAELLRIETPDLTLGGVTQSGEIQLGASAFDLSAADYDLALATLGAVRVVGGETLTLPSGHRLSVSAGQGVGLDHALTLAGGRVLLAGGSGAVSLASLDTLTLEGASTTAALSVVSGADLTLTGLLSGSQVSLVSANHLRGQSGAQVSAQTLSLSAGGDIGSATTPLAVATANLDAVAAQDLYLNNAPAASSVTLTRLQSGGVLDYDQQFAVGYPSGAVGSTQLDVLSSGGDARLQFAASDLTLGTVSAQGDLVVATTGSGDMTLSGGIVSGNGMVDLTAAGALMQRSALRTAGAANFLLRAQGGALSMGADALTGSVGGTIDYRARDRLTVSYIDAGYGVSGGGSGQVLLTSQTENLTSLIALTPSVRANSVTLDAALNIGLSYIQPFNLHSDTLGEVILRYTQNAYIATYPVLSANVRVEDAGGGYINVSANRTAAAQRAQTLGRGAIGYVDAALFNTDFSLFSIDGIGIRIASDQRQEEDERPRLPAELVE